MFDRIAARYDLLNRLMSGGLDGIWRKRLIAAVAPALVAGGRVLDVATGTADVALALARARPQVQVVGLDPSPRMLAIALQKVVKRGAEHNVALLEGDGQALPFPSQSFDACCIAFGIRNVPQRDLALAEMCRVTRRGGIVALLELSEPRGGLLASLGRLHVRAIVPRLGAWLSGSSEYRYLQASMEAFPPAEAFSEQLRAAGLNDVRVSAMGLGAVHLFSGTT